jgi:hypothetical protein
MLLQNLCDLLNAFPARLSCASASGSSVQISAGNDGIMNQITA